MKRSKISVVVPVYNQERYIEETLESVLSQKEDELELIVVNDGSSDQSGEFIKKFSSQIVLIEQANQGVAVARNNGVKASSGELIAFLDGDDRYLPGHLSKILEFAQREPQAILFYGDAWVIDEKGTRLWVQGSETEPNLVKLLLKNFIIASSVVVRRKLFEEGEWFEDFHPAEDWDLSLRAWGKGEFIHYPWIGVEYRKHEQSAIKTRLALAEEMSKKVLERVFEREPELEQRIKNRAYASLYYQSAVRFLSAQENQEARKRLITGLGYNWLMIKGWLGLGLSLLPKAILKLLVQLRRKIKQ